MSGTDHIRAALALGIDVTPAEMRRLQRDVAPGEAADLIESDPIAAAGCDELLPELRRRLAASDDKMLAVAAGLHPEAPRDLIDKTMARRDVQSVLTSRPERLPKHVVAVVATDGTSSQRRAIARSIDDQQLLDRLASDSEPVVRTSVATNANTAEGTVARLADDERQGVRAAVARRKEIDPDVLRRLTADESDLVRGSAAANKSCDARELTAMAQDDSIRVRMSVAGNPQAPSEVLASLGEDAEARVRGRLGANHATPGATLAVLAEDDEPSVILRVARNPSSDPALLAGLVGRAPDAALAANRSATSALLDLLADRSVLLGTGEHEPRRSDRALLFELARHRRCGPELLERLITFGLGAPSSEASSNDRLGVVRRLATSQPLSAETQRRFAQLEDAQVRSRLAKRDGDWAPPPDVFEVLAADDRLRIARSLAGNDDAPPELRARAEARIEAAAEQRRRRAARRVAARRQ